MRQTYASHLTRDYLEYLGITEVSEDGTKIMKGDKELTQHYDGHYLLVNLYDPALRQACPAELRTNSTGQLHIGVHRIVYCWYNKIIPTGLVIDHINSNKIDNRLQNLRLFTPKENVGKERPESTRELKCKLNKPRSFYEEKLEKYEALYEKAKYEHNAEEAHKQRANIANIKAKLRYYDAHINDVNEVSMSQEKKDIKYLNEVKKTFKESGNKKMWHELCKVINAWDSLEDIQKQHVFETLDRFFGR